MWFWLFAVVCVLGALWVALARDPIKGALGLIVAFIGLAAVYVLQAAEFIATLQILVYAGAVMVLFVFVLMLVESQERSIWPQAWGLRLQLVAKCLVVGLVAYVFWRSFRGVFPSAQPPIAAEFGAVKTLGRQLLGENLFHFELISVLLLVGIVGAVVVSKKSET